MIEVFWVTCGLTALSAILYGVERIFRSHHEGLALRTAAETRPENFGLMVYRTDDKPGAQRALPILRPGNKGL